MKVKASNFHHICTNNESESDHLSMCSKITSVIDINSDRQVGKVKDGERKFLHPLPSICCKQRTRSSLSDIEPQWREVQNLPTMWQVVQFSTVFEDTFVHSQWGEATQMQTMQLFNNNKANTWNPHENSQWRKASHLSTMQKGLQSSWKFKHSPAHTHRREAIQVCTMYLFSHNKASSCIPPAHTQWREAT